MRKQSFTVVYSYVWEVSFANHYKFTKCGKMINGRTGRELKKKLNGYTKGYNIGSKFYSIKSLRTHLIRIQKIEIPF